MSYDERLHQAAKNLVHRLVASSEAQDAEEADSWIVSAYDPETDRQSFIGSFTDPVEALQFAEGWADELNHGLATGDALFSTAIHPMMDPNR